MTFQIPGYPPGSRLQIINVEYASPRPDKTGKWDDGTLYVVYRDLETNEVKLYREDNPKTHTYITKPEYYNAWPAPRVSYDLAELDEYVVPYKSLTNFVYSKMKEYGDLYGYNEYDEIVLNNYKMALESKSKSAKKEIFKYRHSAYADYDIKDYVMTQFNMTYGGSKQGSYLTKGYLDIEVDIYQRPAKMRDEGLCPVTLITLVFNHNSNGEILDDPVAISLVLRNHMRYPRQAEIEDKLKDILENEMDTDAQRVIGTPRHIVKFYDDDVDMIKTAFDTIHHMKTNFMAIWNMSFDIPYLINRCKARNYSPEKIMCHPDFGKQHMFYWADTRNRSDFTKSGDYFSVLSYTKYICAMRLYAKKRKHKSDYGGNSLDNVTNLELKVGKVDFQTPGIDVINALPKGYCEEFYRYGIRDTLIMHGLEEKIHDIDGFYDQAINMGVRFDKVTNASYNAKTAFDLSYFMRGRAPKNNVNINYLRNNFGPSSVDDIEYDESDFDNAELAGALVACPNLNAHNGIMVNGKRSNKFFSHCLYLDFEALYPNVIIVFNLSPDCQYGRIIIDVQVFDNENPLDDPKWIRGGKFVEDYEIGEWTKIGEWFGLEKLADYISEFLKEHAHEIQ